MVWDTLNQKLKLLVILIFDVTQFFLYKVDHSISLEKGERKEKKNYKLTLVFIWRLKV